MVLQVVFLLLLEMPWNVRNSAIDELKNRARCG
jgi:hypothetical protein